MKRSPFTLAALLLFLSISSFSQNAVKIDLHNAVKNNWIQVYNRELSLINEEGYPGIRLSKDYGEGIAWLKDVELLNGIIEFDVRGENVKQHSFVGIAFHGKNDSTFDAIYLRPFQFYQEDAVLRNHDIQFISLPHFTWQVLREKFPDKFEHSIEPAPDPNAWIRLKIVINNNTVSTYINGSKQPSMIVEKPTSLTSGAIGFYVADTSGGDFANITITKTN